MSKLNKLRAHLLAGRTITGLEAIELYGYYRLSDGILRLRRGGMAITTLMVEGKDSRYAVYRRGK